MKRGFRMKKHLIIAGIICAASIPPAYAVTKCVKLTSSTSCTTSSGGGANWSATCGDIEIQGVAFCGQQDGGSRGATSEFVMPSAAVNSNQYCWCKMVSPAVSSWVFSASHTSGGSCMTSCASSCAYSARTFSAFRSGLFSGLSD